MVTQHSVFLEHCRGDLRSVYYKPPLNIICNKITVFFHLGYVAKVCDIFIFHTHIKRPIVTIFISEGGACITVAMQYGSKLWYILEVPFQKCGMIGSVYVKV